MEHHERAIARYVAEVSADPSVLAVIVSGSVARGAERPDSDVDLYLVVTEERWDAACAARRLMYTSTDGIGYDEGYFDIKLATLSYLSDAAERGDDPVRDSFASARVVFSRVPDLDDRLARVVEVPAAEWEDRVAGFVAQCRLHGGYFLPQAYEHGDPLLLAHAAVHLVTSAARALLAHNAVFFPGPKYLRARGAMLPRVPDGFGALLDAVIATPTPETAGALLEAVEAFVGDALPRDETLSRFVLDNELAWRYRTAPPEYS
ncbi:nucleotidyltransferase domain-containing protein [Leifsonia shinshuensis]|uniref:Putative nucleotidyltransferase n=1 Tax=Leifsonia shinshuensis TaxID=150026 RepID=A0A853CMW9_9MICO|nr:nucleotidyltransferase domain-containing protein [Leifsonia shinshuensis]NYJ21812.1 putative nucleotidyltransferase [Leifsonia shinshuensis]